MKAKDRIGGIGATVIVGAIGIIPIIIGIADFVVAYGLWKGKGRAWIITYIIISRIHYY